MKRVIVFLVRKRLKLKKYEKFRFANQKSGAIYYFDEDSLVKFMPYFNNMHVHSGVSLNWLLDDGCEIVKLED